MMLIPMKVISVIPNILAIILKTLLIMTKQINQRMSKRRTSANLADNPDHRVLAGVEAQ